MTGAVRAWIVAVLGVLMPLACGGSEAGTGGGGKGMSSEEIARNVLDLPPERFFDYGLELDLELTERLDEHDFEGIAIGAPPRVDVAERKALPVIAASVSSGRRQAEVDFTRNAVLVAVDLATGKVRSGPAHAPDPTKNHPRPSSEEAERSSSPPNETMAAAVVSGTDLFDLRASVGLPWRPGRYAVTLVSWDWRSNTVEVELIGRGEVVPEPVAVETVARPLGEDETAPDPGGEALALAAKRDPDAADRIEVRGALGSGEGARDAEGRPFVTIGILARDAERIRLKPVRLPEDGAGFVVTLPPESEPGLGAGEHLVFGWLGRAMVGPVSIAGE